MEEPARKEKEESRKGWCDKGTGFPKGSTMQLRSLHGELLRRLAAQEGERPGSQEDGRCGQGDTRHQGRLLAIVRQPSGSLMRNQAGSGVHPVLSIYQTGGDQRTAKECWASAGKELNWGGRRLDKEGLMTEGTQQYREMVGGRRGNELKVSRSHKDFPTSINRILYHTFNCFIVIQPIS